VAQPSLGAVTLFVGDVDVAKEWYQRAFDVPVLFEDEHSSALQFGNTIVNLLVRSEASELVAPVPVAGAGIGATSQFTVWTDDVAAVVARLASRGISLLNGPFDRPWGQRTVCIVDPDGNVWEFAQTIG
jgi:catechol 2,3-dioxygenase-like lactoylglutathione lyase family enzyme